MIFSIPNLKCFQIYRKSLYNIRIIKIQKRFYISKNNSYRQESLNITRPIHFKVYLKFIKAFLKQLGANVNVSVSLNKKFLFLKSWIKDNNLCNKWIKHE